MFVAWRRLLWGRHGILFESELMNEWLSRNELVIEMNRTREHLADLAFTMGLLAIMLNVAIVLFDFEAVTLADTVQMLAPALLYAFSLWLWSRGG